MDVFFKYTERRDELSSTCTPKVMSRCLSAPHGTSKFLCLKNKKLKLILFLRIQVSESAVALSM